MRRVAPRTPQRAQAQHRRALRPLGGGFLSHLLLHRPDTLRSLLCSPVPAAPLHPDTLNTLTSLLGRNRERTSFWHSLGDSLAFCLRLEVGMADRVIQTVSVFKTINPDCIDIGRHTLTLASLCNTYFNELLELQFSL